MANWTDNSKLDRLWKALFNKARTSPDKQFFEENIPTTFDLHANEIYAEEIPRVPPELDTEVIKKVNIALTQDRTVSGNRAWVALNAWSPNWSSGSGDITQIIKNFISPKYGPLYTVKVFNGNNIAIPELDDKSWIFDYKAGVLLFESDPGQDGNAKNTSIKIEAYLYIGKMVSDGVGSGGSGEDVNLEELDQRYSKIDHKHDLEKDVTGLLPKENIGPHEHLASSIKDLNNVVSNIIAGGGVSGSMTLIRDEIGSVIGATLVNGDELRIIRYEAQSETYPTDNIIGKINFIAVVRKSTSLVTRMVYESYVDDLNQEDLRIKQLNKADIPRIIGETLEDTLNHLKSLYS